MLAILVLTAAGVFSADEPVEEAIFFPHDRSATQRLTKAHELIAERRFSEAVRLLGAILGSSEDVFLTPSKADARQRDRSAAHRSLKFEARRLLGELPEEGREAYETEFGTQAADMLKQAEDSGDVELLATAARRFFHTQAGYQATWLLGTVQLEQGRAHEATVLFSRLLHSPAAAKFEPLLSVRLSLSLMRSGQVREAIDRLLAISRDHANDLFYVAGQQRKLLDLPAGRAGIVAEQWTDRKPKTEELVALAWLQDVAPARGPRNAGARGDDASDNWPMFRGSASRNTDVVASRPVLNRRWQVPTANDPNLARMADQLSQSYLDQEQPVLPSIQPIAVGRELFTRSTLGLVAVDERSGKRVWTGNEDDAARQFLDTAGETSGRGARPDVGNWLNQRLWEDAVYGMLSSDGESVFCVEDLAPDNDRSLGGVIFMQPGRRGIRPGFVATSAQNRLVSYRIASQGKLDWEAGGPPGEDELPLAGAFFLGPPLPLDGRLYALAEIKGEIRLLALRTVTKPGSRLATIDLEWSQQLALLEQGITDDPVRRLAGAMPSYADGVLVCPTSAGAVIGIDVTTRSLLWGYQYRRNADNTNGNPFAVANMRQQMPPAERWSEATVLIASGAVLVTPVESAGLVGADELYCLDLRTGQLRWKTGRDHGLFLGGVENDEVLVVGRHALAGVSLANGETRWTLELPTGARPSGRGYMTAGAYCLPLSTGEVALFDLHTHQLASRVRSRSGNVPGNLIAHHGMILSQTALGLECFFQSDELRRHIDELVAKRKDDPQALAFQGELALDAGRVDEGLKLLRRAHDQGQDPRTTRVLLDALLSSLRTDFARSYVMAKELEPMFVQSTDRVAYLCAMASGLAEESRLAEAFDYCLKLSDLPAAERGVLTRIEPGWSVHPDRWVRTQVALLRQKANDEQRQSMNRALQARLDSAVKAADPAALRSFIDCFSEEPLADDARWALVTRGGDHVSGLELESWLLRLMESTREQHVRAGTARLALLLKQAHRVEDARPLVETLRAWGEAVCFDGRSARSIAAEVVADAPSPTAWPTGRVRSETPKIAASGSARMQQPLELRGPRGLFFARAGIELDQQQQTVIGFDGWGKERWRASLADPSGNVTWALPQLTHVRVSGHLALASMGLQMAAIDTLGTPGGTGPRVLWREELGDILANPWRSGSGVMTHQGNSSQFITSKRRQQRSANILGRPIGELRLVMPDLVCFQRQRNLIAVHPLTGRVQWTRHGISLEADIFNDEQRLYITQPDSDELLVLRATDGAELGHRLIAPTAEIVIAGPKQVVFHESDGSQVWLRCRDLWAEKVIWERKLKLKDIGCLFDDRLIGVLGPDGKFTLLAADDGHVLASGEGLDKENVNDLFLYETPERWLVVTSHPAAATKGESYETPLQTPYPPVLINGHVYGFDRATGKQAFATPVENRHLINYQPADIPVLIFASHIHRRSGLGNVPAVGTFLCIDKRNGRVVYNDKLTAQIQVLMITGDPQKHEVQLRTPKQTIKLAWTDEPWPPAEEPQPPKEDSLPTRAGRALGKGLQKWIEGMANPISPF
ncbi:MAG: PQQ-like beta-propeller repeat protein [Planctomycetes bacterium]|nr:PQQ-like beta-propeller repeat protein [Planctomycetota bacterium]